MLHHNVQDHHASSGQSLPGPLSPMVGREREIDLASSLLADPNVRLVTLTGPGGVGKTRLALHLAIVHHRTQPDVFFLPLAATRDPEHVMPAVARAVGLRGTDARPLVERLAHLLHGRQTLLVLDNFEQVIAAAPVIATLLRACPGLTVLVTSRGPLRISGEHDLEIRPLAVPNPTRLPPTREVLQNDAVAFFLARLAAVRPGFVPSEAELPAIVAICQRLDGIPLALELAAARCKMLTPTTLLGQLSHRLPLLTAGPRDLPWRLRSMREAIAWSYSLLAPEEQARFRRLSIFTGGFTLDAAEAIDDEPMISILDAITTLADQSLLHRIEESHATARLAMLETIREFGVEQLRETGEEHAIRSAHAAWCIDLAARSKAMFWGTAPGSWRELLEPEHANLRAGFAWLMNISDHVTALRLATDLEPFWWVLGNGAEGARWLRRAFDRSPNAPASLRAEALVVMARLSERAQDYATARKLAAEALAIAHQAGDEPGVARAIDMQALIALQTGDVAAARPLTDDVIRRFRHLGDRGRLAWALCNRATLPMSGSPTERDMGIALCTKALAIFRDLDHPVGIGRALNGIAVLTPDSSEALGLLQESIPFLRRDGAVSGVASTLEAIAALAYQHGHTASAARIFGGADAIRDTCAVYQAPHFRPALERVANRIRETMGNDPFDAANANGRAMSTEQLLALAMQPFPLEHSSELSRLTPRQREILEHIADGQGNREIADALFISVRTVEDHVSNLMARLGVTSRTRAAALARANRTPSPPPDAPGCS